MPFLLYNTQRPTGTVCFHLIGARVYIYKYDHNPIRRTQDCQHPLIRAAAAKSLRSCATLWNPIDGSPAGSPVPGTLQARTLEWVAISFSNAWKWKVKVKPLNHVWLAATPGTSAYQTPPSMGFSRQEYWSGLPLPLLKRAEWDWKKYEWKPGTPWALPCTVWISRKWSYYNPLQASTSVLDPSGMKT